MPNLKALTIFSQHYFPDMTTTALIMTDLSEDLAHSIPDVEVVCGRPTYLKNKDARHELFNDETLNNVKVKRVWSCKFDKDNSIGRILNSSSCFLSMLLVTLRLSQQRVLVFNTNPALLPIAGFVSSILRKHRYIILVHDLWPELPANIGIIKENGFLFRILDYFNKKAFEKAALVVAISNSMKRVIAQKGKNIGRRISVIHNWADSDRVFPVLKKNNLFIKEFGLENKKIVMYSGNIGRYQPVEVMVQAAERLKNRRDIVFIFAGDGAKKQKIVKMAKSKGLENIKFIPFQPLIRLAESLSMADVSLLGIYPTNEGVVMPSKLYGLLAIGRPIICLSGKKSEVAAIIKKAGAGVQVSIDSSQELAHRIVEIVDNEKMAKTMGSKGLKYFKKNFERKIVTEQWRDLIVKNLAEAN